MASGNTETVRLPVELALEHATQQAKAFEALLKKSVNPDSNVFKTLIGQLTKMEQKAASMKTAMDSAFKTSQGSAKFQKDMEGLFDSLNSISKQFGTLNIKDLINFDNATEIKDLETQLDTLQKNIKELEKNKIGNLFEGDTKGFKELRDFIGTFSKDITKVSFTEFETAMSKSMNQVTQDIDSAKKAVQDFQNQTNAVKMDNIASVIKDLNSAVNQVEDGVQKKVFTKIGASEVKQQIKDLYERNGLSTQISPRQKDVTEKIGAGSSFETTINEQTQNIDKALEAQTKTIEARAQELEVAKAKINEVLKSKTYVTDDGEKLSKVEEKAAYIKDTILKNFSNIDFGGDFTKGSGLSKWAENIQNILTEQINTLNIDNLKQSLHEQLNNIFNSVDYEQIVSGQSGVAKLKQAIESKFAELKIDISAKDNPVRQLLNSLRPEYDFNKFGQDLNNAISQMGEGYADKLAALQQKLAEFEEAKRQLEEIQTTFNTGTSGQSTVLEQDRQAAENLAVAINNLKIAFRDANAAQAQGLSDKVASSYDRAREAVLSYTEATQTMERRARAVSNVQNMISRWMGFYQVLNLTKRAVKEAANHIKELDTVMNKISIVTNMDTSDLWGQIDQYSKMAQTYGTTIKGAYEVSQIYYQQGLETADVLTLTNETLKLAKISGLDYATTTDYMTTAIRGFKMEMQDAATVVDVYSALAASTAVSQEELAVAMSKTASSMESVGSTFEETSAMIATMVAVTRESATNIGSAMKSIASRYGELTKDPTALMDSEGEAMSFNKVDTALQSVGISMKTAEGQFRKFTDVILELSEKWNQLESVQQRYIATQFAGNRQQSRFLALVSNKDLLEQNLEVTKNSEDVGTVQALKALDSLDSKIEQVRVAYQQFYTTIGVEEVWKSFLDGAKNAINVLNGMPKLFGKLPVAAVNAIAQIVALLKNVALSGLTKFASQIMPILSSGQAGAAAAGKAVGTSWIDNVLLAIKGKQAEVTQSGHLIASYLAKGFINENSIKGSQLPILQNYMGALSSGTGNLMGIGQQLKARGILTDAGFQQFTSSTENANAMLGAFVGQAQAASARMTSLGNIVSGVGQVFSMLSLTVNSSTQSGKRATGAFTLLAGAIQGIAIAIQAANTGLKSVPIYMWISAVTSVIAGISQLVQANSLEAQLEEVSAKAEELSNKAKELKANYNTIDNSIKKLQELEKTRYDSAEAAEEYQTAVDKLAEAYPELVSSYEDNNKAVIRVNEIEQTLAKARDESAAATLRATQAEADKAKLEKEAAIKKLHTENDDLEDYTLLTAFGGKADVNITKRRKLNRDSIRGEGVDALTDTNLEELYDFIDRMKNAGEAGEAEKVISTYNELKKYLIDNNINFDDDLTKAIGKAVNAAYDVQGYDKVIETANRASVSAFMNDYYGNSKSTSILKDNSGLMAAATETLYNSVWNGQYDTVSLTQLANDIFAGIDTLYVGMNDQRKKEIESILSNPSHYSVSDLPPELTNTEWIKTYFTNQIENNKTQMQEKINQLKNNRKAADEGKLNEALTLTEDQIEQFNSLIGDNLTLDLRNLMNLGIGQAQNLKQTGQNPQEFIDNFIKFYPEVAKLPADLRNDLINQFSTNGFTKEGITKTLNWINDNKEIQGKSVNFSSLEDMASSFIPTYSLTVASLEDQLTGNLDDIESLFSDLQSGIKGSKLEKTIAKAKELGLDLSREDFTENGDKFILEYKEFARLISKLNEIYTTGLPKEDEFQDAYNNLIRLNNGEKEVDLGRNDDIKQILGITYHDYFDANDHLKDGIEVDQVYDALEKAYNSTSADIAAYQAWLETIEDHLTKAADWKHGDYSTLEGKVDLTKFDSEGNAIDTAYKRVQYLAAHPEAYTENELKEADVPNAVDTYSKGLSSLLTDLSKYGASYLVNRGQSYDGVASETVSEIQQIASSGTDGVIKAIRQYGQSAKMTVSEINDAIIKALGSGKGTSVANMISGRKTTLSDINSFFKSYDPDHHIEDFLDQDQNLTGPLAAVYDYNNLTGELKLKRDATLEAVLTAYNEALKVDITQDTDLLQQVTQQWIADFINSEDQNDADKQMATAISSLSSAKVGTRVNLSKSPELQAKLQELGYNVTDGYYEVVSEYIRDSLILALSSDEEEVQATLLPLQREINKKRSKGQARLGISGITMSAEAYDSWINTWGNASTMSDSLKHAHALEDFGYRWDKDLQQYVATVDAITHYDEEIAYAIKQGASDEYIRQLREKRGELAAHFRKDEKRDALSNVLSNYEDAADYIDNLYTQFGEGFSPKDLEKKGVLTEVNGKQVINVEKLQELVDGYDDLFKEVISQIADEYINNAQKAGSLMTQGTTSKTEMDAFQKAYKTIMGNEASADFIYDSITHTMVLDPKQLRSYLAGVAARKEFGLTPEQQKDWVDSQIKALTADNLDFSKVLDGSATQKDKDTLKRNLKQYFETNSAKLGYMSYMGDLEEWAENRTKSVMDGLSEGGQAAIDAMKSTGKELSTDEIKAAYRAQVAPLSELADTLSTLEKGSIVAKNQIEALRSAGFTVNDNGVIKTTGNLVAAYRSIYTSMRATNEATISELNKLVGNILDRRDNEQGAIDALANATSMTYSQFAEIFSNAGIEISEQMIDGLIDEGTIKHLGGNKMMITNFEHLAEVMQSIGKWNIGSEEYIKALSTYRDGLITYDKQLGNNIKASFDAISNAKVGDKINLTYVLEKFPLLEEQLESKFGAIIDNGILTITNALDLPQIAMTIGSKAVETGGMLSEELNAFLASIHDNILNGITKSFGYASNGTNSITDMQAFATEYNTLTKENKDYSELFGYDTAIDAFTLNQEAYNNYVEAQKKQLETLGLSGRAIDEYIKDQTDKVLRENIELDNFLNANTNKQKNTEANKLISSIRRLSNYQDLLKDLDRDTAMQYFKEDDFSRYLSDNISLVSDQYDLAILHVLENGGQAAVDLFKKIKPDATEKEIQAVYASQINKLNDVMDQVENLVVDQFVGTKGKLHDILARANAVDNEGVVQAGFSLVAVYAAIYAEMGKTLGHTNADLNKAYVKLLTAQDQQEIDILDALSNASGMTYEALGNILTKYSDQTLEEFMQRTDNGVFRSGFGKIRVTDWETFAKAAFNVENLDLIKNTPEYLEAYKAYNEGLINYDKEISSNIRDEIKSLAEAKAGDKIQLTYLWSQYGEDSLNTLLNGYGASIHDGILTLGEKANIGGIMTRLGQLAAAAGDMIPSELAELEDAIAKLLSNIADLIGKGFTGELNNAEKQSVDSWAVAQKLNINWQKTADGWKIVESSIWDCYNAVNALNVAEGEKLRAQIKEQKIAHDDYYADSQRTAAYIQDLESELSYEQQFREVSSVKKNGGQVSAFARLNGNVDMTARPHVKNSDGTYSTMLGTEYLNEKLGNQEVHVLMTPIPQWATSEDDYLSGDQLNKYFSDLMDKNPVDVQALLKLDQQGLEIDGKHFSNLMIDVQDAAKVTAKEFAAMEQEVHDASEAWEDLRDVDEAPDNSERITGLEEELALAREINAERATSKDDSFDFMNNKIPAGQENPLTYAQNLTKAFKAINDAYKVNNTYDLNAGGIKRTSTGYMAYQDFYNIINELNHMAAVSGQAIEIGHTIEGNAYRLDGSLESASNFINEGIKTLTAVDSGEMMVNIGALGINLAKGGKNLKNGIQDGVDAIADAEIAAIDAMISVLEVIVAMEKLKEIDADQDMTIDLGEMFKFEVPDDLTSNIIGFTDKYDKIRAWLVDQMGKNKDLAKAMNEFKFGINGQTKSMAEWLNLSFEELGLDQDGLRAYNKAISAFYTAAMSNDYDLDKVAESVKQVLIDSGVTDLEVDVGDYSLIIKGGNVSVIDWRSEGAEDAIKAYLKENKLNDNAENRKTTQGVIQEAVRKYTEGGTLSKIELETVLRLNNHYVIDENGDITGVRWNGATYDTSDPEAYRKAIAMNFLKDRGILDPDRQDMDKDLEIDGSTYTYKVTSGRKGVEFILEFDDEGGITKGKYIVGGKEYDSLAQAQDKEYEEIIKDMEKQGMTEDEAKKAYSKDVYLWDKWRIRAKVETEFTDADGNKFDINGPSGASYRKELQSFQDNVKGITQNEGGNIDIEMSSGVKFTIPGDQVTYEIDENGKPTQKTIDSINNYVQQALLGHDLSLQENITAAITQAFDALPGALEALNGQDTSGLTSIATTIGDIASNASTAATNVGTLVEKLGLLMGGNFKKPTQEVNTPKEAPKTSTGPQGLPPDSKLYASAGAARDVNFVDNKDLVNQTEAAGAEAGTAGGQTAVTTMTEEVTKLPGAIDKSGTKEDTATEFESIGDYAAETFRNEFSTLATQLASDINEQAGQFKEAMKPAADAIASSMNEALAEFENRTVSTLGSVRSHWDTLVKNIIAAVAVIMALVQTMQQKISITWDIKTPLGNLAGEGSGNTEIAEALSAAMSGIQDILPALIQQWTEIAKSVTSGPDGIAPKLKIDTTDAETSLRSIKESLTTIQENANIDIAINGELDAIKTGLQTIASLLETISKSSNINITSGKLPEEPSTSKSDSEKQAEEEVGVTVKAENVDTSGVEGQPVTLTAKITFEEIPQIETTQTISTEGGVSDIPDFTTIQYIETRKGKGPGGGCFIAGTQISMADGTTKNIEDIKVGDLVVAYDYKLKKFVPGKVNKAYIHHNTPRLIKITFSNNNYLILTPGHPLLSTKGWKSRDIENSLYEHKTDATWLEIGDEIIGLNNNLIVTDIQEMEVPKNYDTYNAEVEIYHTFIANGLVAHNSKTAVDDGGPPIATGNVGLAKAKGTLMGELGPELVVSNGRYFVAGQNGPEMVDLADDAIVFNHLQTESLLKKGMSNERGRAVTNERNAVAFATGNVNGGPAMASASAALAALKQLRAMWESLKSASVSDLAGAGGGGGGGGGGDKDKVIDPKAWVDTVERWFNLMQEIAKLEREITHEETLRSKIQSDWLKDGKAYVKSQRLSLNALKAQLETQEQLNLSRREYFNKRIEALEKEPLGKLYTFDADTGKMQFKDSIINGKDGVMEFLTDLVGFDNLKGANHTNKEKYEILMAAGFGDYMKFDDSGNEIKADADNNGETTEEEWESFYENTTKAFWSHIDEFKASTESLWESIAEGENKILELETSMNEQWQEIRENQMSLEEEVLKAIEDMKQREIDALSEEREALEASTQEYIQGLSDALNKEREMYETQEQEDELNRKRRRLGILERSGASAADITSLQQEIDDQERDLYFDIQQQQIDAIQEASDKEIERLDNQIDIMTQQLEFQKEFGLLWNDVYQVMNSSAQQIVSFIMNGNSEFWASSPLSTADGFHNLLFQAEAWKEYSDNMDTITNFANFQMKEKMALAYNTYDTAMKNEFGGSYDQGNRYMKAGGYKEIFDSVYSETGDLTKATETVRKTYSNHKKYLDREAQANSFGVPWKKDNGDTEYRAIDDNEHWAFRYARENINGVEAYYFQSATRENHSWNNGECSKCHHKQPAPPMPAGGGFGGGGSGDSSKNIAYYERNGTKYRHVLMDGTKGPWIEEAKAGQNAINFVKRKEENQNKQQEEQKKRKTYASIISTDGKHASGGYVGHGIYELGELGTETVLTAEQTQVLRNNILSNRPNSLISLLKSYNQGYSQISKPLTGITTTEDNSTTIEKVELNMNVQKIANDYDAKRAGEQALLEMLRIAKKTSAANSVRR